MKYSIVKKSLAEIKTDGLIVPIFEKEEIADSALPDILKTIILTSAIKTGDFKGKKSELMLLPVAHKLENIPRMILVGFGEKEKYNLTTLRDVFGKCVTFVQKYPLTTVTLFSRNELVLDEDWSRFGQTVMEGFELGAYKFENYKSKKENDHKKDLKTLELFAIPEQKKSDVRSGLKTGTLLTEAVKFSRDLGNHPGNVVTPKMLAKTAKTLAADFGLNCEILTEKKMQSLKMNALLAVAEGSSEPPRLIVLEYLGAKKRSDPFVFVGKGVTFDSGGISLKPSKNMDEMKFDMCGGGAVLGILRAVAALKLPLNIVGIVPAVENLPGGKATKPGDIVKSMSGSTIEVLNTDAEGRLILADALTYAERYKPQAVVNLATLTGAVVVALGHAAAGIMGNDGLLVDEIKNISEISGERIWPFPLFDDYKEQIKSSVADVKNIGQEGAGVTTAGAFLSNFTENYKWAHIDIAGVAWTTKAIAIAPKGATGFGVRLLVEWLRSKV